MKEIARKAGVSVATVSRVINKSGYVSATVRERVLAAIDEHGYSPNIHAVNLVKGTSNVIGLLVPQIDNPFFIKVIIEIEAGLRRRGYTVMLCHTDEDLDLERAFLDLLAAQRVAGIITTPVGVDCAPYREIIKRIPTVILSRHFKDLDVSWVDLDNYGASYNIVTHLVRQGNRRIAVLSNEGGLSSIRDRLDGAHAAAADCGLGKTGLVIVNTSLLIEESYETMREFLKKPGNITAIYALHTMPGLGAMRALDELGIPIPERIALAAFNGMDDSPYRSLFARQLTGNRHPTEAMCRRATDMLFSQMDVFAKTKRMGEPEQEVFRLELLERESSLFERKQKRVAR